MILKKEVSKLKKQNLLLCEVEPLLLSMLTKGVKREFSRVYADRYGGRPYLFIKGYTQEDHSYLWILTHLNEEGQREKIEVAFFKEEPQRPRELIPVLGPALKDAKVYTFI